MKFKPIILRSNSSFCSLMLANYLPDVNEKIMSSIFFYLRGCIGHEIHSLLWSIEDEIH